MTTANDIIEQAYREANIVPIGKSPSTDEINEALPRLNNFIDWLFGTKLGEFVMDWPVPPSRTAPVAARFPLRPQNEQLPADVWPYPPNNVRLLNNLEADTTVYLPYRPNPGAQLEYVKIAGTGTMTINANGRLISGGLEQVIDVALSGPLKWVYREDLANWVQRTTLTTADESPLAPDFDDLLITGLAKRIAPRFGAEVLASTQETYVEALDRLKKRYQQYMPKGGGFDPVLMSKQAHDEQWFSNDEGLYGY